MAKIKVPGAKKPKKAVRVTAAHVQAHREHAKKDHSPKWEGHENWSKEEFSKHWHHSMAYYRMEYDDKQCKTAIITWMTNNGYDKSAISTVKSAKDWRISSTMGGIAACLNRGMPHVRDDFNNGRCTSSWLGEQVARLVEESKADVAPEVKKEVKPAGPVLSIQDRVREASLGMTEEIEDALESFYLDKDKFDPKGIKILNILKGKEAKAAHARVIKDFYSKPLAELQELASGKGDEQLREGYGHMPRKYVKKLIEFYAEIESACTMLMEEAKVARKPRAKKVVPKDKLVEKLKYLKTFETLKLVSVNPTDIIGAKELWTYNTKTRKLGKYVAAEFAELGVKGTSIIGFDENKSIQKTLRKPAEQITAFKAAGKVQLRKFLDDINAVDTKLNGRINEDIILLKVA